jgi:hypothetical protein
MSENMFRLRLRNEAHMRSKNGQPPHSTTGAESASSIHGARCAGTSPPSACPPIASTTTAAASGALIQSRRLMDRSSGSSTSSSDTVRGSSAIPQMGHDPGPSRTISGCMGHVQLRGAAAEPAAATAPCPRPSPSVPCPPAPPSSWRNASGSAAKRSLQRGLQKK